MYEGEGKGALQTTGYPPSTLVCWVSWSWVEARLQLTMITTHLSNCKARSWSFLAKQSHRQPRFHSKVSLLGHFRRVNPSLCIKARLSTKPLIWKFFILMQMKFMHLASFWKWGFSKLKNGLLALLTPYLINRRFLLQRHYVGKSS